MSDVCGSVIVPLAGPGALHREHHVFFNRTVVHFAHVSSSQLQVWAQRPHVVQDGDEEFMRVLQKCTQSHTEKITHKRKEKTITKCQNNKPWNELTYLLVEICELWILGWHRPLERGEEAEFVISISGTMGSSDIQKWSRNRDKSFNAFFFLVSF